MGRMDIRLVLSLLLPRFRASRIRYAVIGGVAVGIHAKPRATRDVDFLVHRDDLQRVHEILVAMGYERLTLTRSFSRYESAAEPFGDVDIQHAAGPATIGMLRRANRVAQTGLRGTMRVVRPEDLIVLKAVAMANQPARRFQDYPDMVNVAKAAGARLRWAMMRGHFAALQKPNMERRLKRDIRK